MKLLLRPALAIVTACLTTLTAHCQETINYRKFATKAGQTFSAIVTEKSGSQITFRLQNGKVQNMSLADLSDPDRQYCLKWTKFKDSLSRNTKFAGLTLKELLELVKYQSFEFDIEGNHIYVEGEINGHKCKMMVDSGAGGSVMTTRFAKEAGIEIGEMTETIYGVAGKAPAAAIKVATLKLGDAHIANRRMLCSDMDANIQGGFSADMIFGADFLRELDAVISYTEGRMFIKPDNLEKAPVAKDEKTGKPVDQPEAKAVAKGEYRRWNSKDGKSFFGTLENRTETEATFKLQNGQTVKAGVDRFSDEDQTYIKTWDPFRNRLAQMPELFSLTVRELLELREFQSFVYRPEGNHIMVDGYVNEKRTRFIVDTGAHGMVIDKSSAEAAKLEIGPWDQKISGIGGTAPAAIGKVPTLTIGEAVIANREVMVADLFKVIQSVGGDKTYDALFGADFMRELDGVINYKEGRIFLKPSQSDKAPETK